VGDCVSERRIKDFEWHVEIVVVVLPIVRDTQFCKLVNGAYWNEVMMTYSFQGSVRTSLKKDFGAKVFPL